jgi:hypothetical protein
MRSTSPPKSRTFLGSGRIAPHNRALRIICQYAKDVENEFSTGSCGIDVLGQALKADLAKAPMISGCYT